MSGIDVPTSYIRARAVAWLNDEPFPGIVRVEVTDADGKIWVFEDKSAIFDDNDVLRPEAHYPVEIELACTVMRNEGFGAGERLIISTSQPWGIETKEGQHELRMRVDQVRRP